LSILKSKVSWPLILKNIWIYVRDRIYLKKLNYLNNNLGGDVVQIGTTGLVKLDSLTINLKKQIKFSYYNFSKNIGWSTSVGVVNKVFKLIEKRERKLEKNKSLTINYIVKQFITNSSLGYLFCKYFNIWFLNLLKKVGFFKKIKIDNLIFFITYNNNFFKKTKRIKRRLRKRILRYEVSSF